MTVVKRIPDDDTSAVRLWMILWKCARAVEQNARDSVAGLGLSLSDFAVLEVLLHKGPSPVNVVGKKVLLTSGSITAALDRLESRGLVLRTAHPTDLRTRLVELTPAGRDLIECAFGQHASDMEETMGVISPRERVELVRLLKKLGLWAAARAGSHNDLRVSAKH